MKNGKDSLAQALGSGIGFLTVCHHGTPITWNTHRQKGKEAFNQCAICLHRVSTRTEKVGRVYDEEWNYTEYIKFEQHSREWKNDSYLFDHSEHGEGALAMAEHLHEVSHLERMIAEDNIQIGNNVQAPHINTGLPPKYLRPEWIQEKLSCDFESAARFAEAFKVLSFTYKLASHYIKEAKANLAVTLFDLSALANELKALEPQEEFEPLADEEEEEREYSPDTIAFHVLGENADAEDRPAWMDSHPTAAAYITAILRASIPQLMEIGQHLHDEPLPRLDASIIWKWYNYRKAAFIRPYALKVIARIKEIPDKTGLRKEVFDLINDRKAHGRAFNKLELKEIWNAFN